MKLKSWFFVLVLFLSVFSFSFVSAQSTISQGVNDLVNGLTEVIKPIAQILVGDVSGDADFSSSDVLFSKTLFLILVFSVIYLAFGNVTFFSSNSTAHFIISLVVALLSTRWLGNADIVQSILLPYTALGITLSAALPFVAWFLIVNVGMKGKVAVFRRVAWILFGVVFVFLWFSRLTEFNRNFVFWVYPVTAIASFVMAWMDGTIRRFWLKINLENLEKKSSAEAAIELKKRLAEIPQLVKDKVLTKQEAEERKKELLKDLKYFSTY